MSITATLVSGPSCPAPNMKMAVYSLALDNSWLAAGEAIDVTGEFVSVHGATVQMSDAVADMGYEFDIEHDYSSTLSASNFKLVAHRSGNSGNALDVVPDATNLSSVGKLTLVVFGQ